MPASTPHASPPKKVAVIIGAGPAGLTAAYELLQRTDITPVVVELNDHVGGLSSTIEYKGNRIDLGGHRFFSKSDRVMDWWLQILPLQAMASEDQSAQRITYQQRSHSVRQSHNAPNPEQEDRVMLLRQRLSRIFFLGKMLPYPLQLRFSVLRLLGVRRTARILCSYLYSRCFPLRPERNLEEFYINRFGRELYEIFFKSYTEKVWGIPCSEMSAEWGAQRVKGLSITKALSHAALQLVRRAGAATQPKNMRQKTTETSLIEQFLYPKFGPGQMWETVAQEVQAHGGQVLLERRVEQIHLHNGRVTRVDARNTHTGEQESFATDWCFSTMPIQHLARVITPTVPQEVRQVSAQLQYRHFLIVGLLVKRLFPQQRNHERIKDNWMYIQDARVAAGRVQFFRNWSPWLVSDPTNEWIGVEYFCGPDGVLWNASDEQMIERAITEMQQIGLLYANDVVDATVARAPYAYPVYAGAYAAFDTVKNFFNTITNLFLIGRNGMHKYNNQDHSMLTAMTAVDQIVEGRHDPAAIWAINTEQEYHEQKRQNEGATS